MNLVVYLLIAGLVIYVLFTFFFRGGKKTGISGEIHLLNSPPDITDVVPSGALNYTYSLWMYVNSWGSSDNKLVFQAVDGSDALQQKLYFDASTAKLMYSVRRKAWNGETGDNKGRDIVQITDAFPLQKWVHVVIVHASKNLDFYIDGKLRHSATMAELPENNTTKIKFGSGFDCHLSKFYREVETNIRAPIEVEREYLSGSGARAVSSASSVHGTVQVVKDGDVAAQIKIF